MSDALAEAVAQAEKELAAIPSHIWIATWCQRAATVIHTMRASLTVEQAKELCNRYAKMTLTWTQVSDSIFQSDYARVSIQGEDMDVRYSVVRVPLDAQ